MIISTRPGATHGELESPREHVEAAGLRTHLRRSESRTVIGCIGADSFDGLMTGVARFATAAGSHVMSPLPRAAAA